MLKKLGITFCVIVGVFIVLLIAEAWDVIDLSEETWLNLTVTAGGLIVLIGVIMGYFHHQADSEVVDKDNNSLIR